MKLKVMIAALLVASGFLYAPAQQTQRLTANRLTEYGLIYTLPSASFTLVVAAEGTFQEPGPFAQYAVRYLREQPITEASQSWKVVGAEVFQTAQADPDERYTVQFKNGSSPYMMLTAEGFPLSVNIETEVPAQPGTTLKAEALPPSILQSEAARQAITPEMMHATTKAKQAELAAARIYEIRRTRTDILSGQADVMPQDGAAMQLVLNQLAAQEEALTAMFLGTTRKMVDVRSYPFAFPDSAAVERPITVARISPTQGLMDATATTGTPIYVQMSNITRAEMPTDDRGRVKSFPKNGFAYRIPGQADLQVTCDGRNLLTRRGLNIPQLGVVFGLDPAMFTDKKNPAYVLLDPLTGALVETGQAEREP